MKPPAPAKRLPKALPLADVEAILEAAGAPGTTLALRDRALLEVLYGTGARISEAVGLDVDDLDDDRRHRAAARQGRQGAAGAGRLLRARGGRRLPGARPARAGRRRGKSGPARCSSTPAAAGCPGSRAWAVLVKAADRAGVTRDVSPHTLRHSFATHLLDGGADVRVVQELLGHASVTTTQVYTLVTVDNLREVFATAHPRARELTSDEVYDALHRRGRASGASSSTRTRTRRSSRSSPATTSSWRRRPGPGSRWWRSAPTGPRWPTTGCRSTPRRSRRWSARSSSTCARCFGADHVGMLTGDASVNPDAPIICCTAEVLANIALREGVAGRRRAWW